MADGDGTRKSNNNVLVDRISNLIDDVIDIILGNLLVPEVVRTSVLSKRWRYSWRRCKNLDFGEDFFERYIRRKEYKLDNTVRTVLSHHSGPVDKFRFNRQIGAREGITFDPCEWMPLLPLTRIHLSIHADNTSPYPHIPSGIFTCFDLQHLELSCCELGPAINFYGFPKLINLRLQRCLMPDDLLKIMISNAPLLKRFVIDLYRNGNPVTINSPQLEHLSVDFEQCMRPVYLENCPELKYMFLATNVVVPVNQIRKSKLEQFVCLLPKIETLHILGNALSSMVAGPIPSKLPTTLQNLDCLDVIWLHIFSPEQIACTFCLIRSSPSLQSLEFSFDYLLKDQGIQAAAQYLESQRREVDQWPVRTLTLDNFSEPELGVLFAHTVLDRCPLLDTMIIMPQCSMERDEEVELLINLMDHPRSSIMIVHPAHEGIMEQILMVSDDIIPN